MDPRSEETYRSPLRAVSRAETFELFVLEGPDAGRVVTLTDGAPILVGAGAACGLRVADPTVAARQCSIAAAGARVRIVDLSPEKTTRVNGVLVAEAHLVGGEIVRIGDTALVVRRPGEAAPPPSRFGRIIGEHPSMVALHARLAELARVWTPVVIAGERGTGKRLVAEELHRRGPFRAGPFVVARARAAEGEPDALTFALVDSATGGTLYVEDASELEPSLVKLLVGLTSTGVVFGVTGEVRADLPAEVVTLPPLRERASDVALLARRFWTDLGGDGSLPDDFVARFDGHAWPGNVRELRIAVEHRIRHGLAVSGIYEVRNDAVRATPPPATDTLAGILERDLTFAEARSEIMAEFERRYVERALAKSGFNVARAAANSGIAHRYFQLLKSRRKSA